MKPGSDYNNGTIGTTVNCPVYGGVPNSESVHVSMWVDFKWDMQSNGVLLKEVAALQRCPLIEVSL